MKKVIIYSIALVALVLVSCSQKYEKEIQEVSDLQTILEGVKQTYGEVDIEKVKFAYDAYKKNMQQYEVYYHSDTLDMDVVNLIDFYKGVKVSAKGIETEYTLLGTNIDFLDKQLTTLKQDLENNIDFGDSLVHFISNEKANVQTVQQNLATIVYNYEYALSVHDSIASKVQSLIIKDVE